MDSDKDLISRLEVADLAELSWPDQLRLAARMRLSSDAICYFLASWARNVIQ